MRTDVAVAASLLIVGTIMASSRQARRGSPGQTAPRATTVVYGGELLGYLTPCGCAKPMLGGMPRRGSVVRRLRQAGPLLAVENGDLIASIGRQDEIKAETLIDMLAAMRYAAIAIGERDARLGAPFLASLRERAGGTLMCANLVDREGNPLFPAMRTYSSSGRSQRAGIPIAAVLSPSVVPKDDPLPDGMHVLDAQGAIRRLAPKLRGGILLYHGPMTEAASAARLAPDLAMVVYAHGPDTPAPPARTGNTLLVCSGAKGKHLGVAVRNGDGRVAGRPSVVLGEAVGDDKSMAGIYRDYQDRVRAEDLLAQTPRFPMPAGSSFAGSAACRPCHAEAGAIWARSKHASAMTTLTRARSDRDPECVPCHAVGANLDGGYRAGDARDLAHVGCESCHGPSAGHTRNPASATRAPSGREACVECHVPEHSPGFRFETYWPKIAH